MTRRSSFAFLAGIFFVTLVALGYGYDQGAGRASLARLTFRQCFLKLDIWGALKLSLLPAIIAILFTDLFDSISTFIGVAHAADLARRKRKPAQSATGFDSRFICDFRRRTGGHVFGHCLHRKHRGH